MSETVVTTHETVFAAVAQFTLLLVLTAMSLFLLRGHGIAPAPMSHVSLAPYDWFAQAGFAPAASDRVSAAQALRKSPTAFDRELAMSPQALLHRWDPFVAEASRRFGLPKSWIRAVISQESGGRTWMGENAPIMSAAGAQGIMQVMPETYHEMRAQFRLGADPANPHDNVIAGTAYLHWLYKKYGYPQMFAAYNDGPGNFDKHLASGQALPPETIAYLASMTAKLSDKPRRKILREASLSRTGDERS